MYAHSETKKPRLLFFQWDHAPNAGLSSYLLLQTNDHVLCLSEHFDVSVVNWDCDYAEMCDRYRPDLVLFESGYQSTASRRPTIGNISQTDRIPRIGLHNADSWSNCRAGFLSDMDHWGIGTYFSICTTTAEYLPCIRDETYIWPNFINDSVYFDYSLEKTIPVMVSGKCHEQYPWRQRVFPLVSATIPSLVCPQFDHGSGLAHRTLTGEAYARTLNASQFALTCGTMAREVVRKHFEIPGAKSCLVCEESEPLKQAGFVHMENCVFADHSNVLDAIDHLMRNPSERTRITQNGHDLVHRRHTRRHRPQIHQWFMLQGQIGADERIGQAGCFGDLIVEPKTRNQVATTGAGLDRALLRSAERHLRSGRLDEARQDYGRCLQMIRYLPEAQFGLAMCDLLEGHARRAGEALAQLVQATTVSYGAADPDPVEWAYFLVSLICQGRPDQARSLSGFYPRLAHAELSHVNRALGLICENSESNPVGDAELQQTRKSLHEMPERTFEDWCLWLTAVLETNQQAELAKRLDPASVSGCGPRRDTTDYRTRARIFSILDAASRWMGLSGLRPNVPPISDFSYAALLRASIRKQIVQQVVRHELGERLRQAWRSLRGRREMKSLRRRLLSRDT